MTLEHQLRGIGASGRANPVALEMADTLRERLGTVSLPIAVEDIAHDLGVEVVFDPTAIRPGELRLANRKVTIVVGAASHARQRQAIGHELGHLVLNIEYGISFQAQVQDPRIERFCDTFARFLLLPRHYAVALQSGAHGMQDVVALSEAAQLPLDSVCAVVLDARGWNGFVLLWAPGETPGSWMVARHISRRPGPRFHATAGTAAALASALDGRHNRLLMPAQRNDRLCELDVSVAASGRYVATWASSMRVVSATDPLRTCDPALPHDQIERDPVPTGGASHSARGPRTALTWPVDEHHSVTPRTGLWLEMADG